MLNEEEKGKEVATQVATNPSETKQIATQVSDPGEGFSPWLIGLLGIAVGVFFSDPIKRLIRRFFPPIPSPPRTETKSK